MLESIRRLGVTDEAVLAAMSNVPRHLFVQRFWWAPPFEPWSRGNAIEFDAKQGFSDQALQAIYEPTTALLTRLPPAGTSATSSVSAPIIVASMLAEMHLGPGLRVLEIGTGSGYNAALLAELVGDPALVTTIDLDPGLTDEASARLERLGFDRLAVRCGDGAEGVADRAPFDRIVATVGCRDVSPAWIEQMDTHGEVLVPLEHGAMHPRVVIRRSAEGLTGRFVGRSAFVRMQGVQADHQLWTGDMTHPVEPQVTSLPPAVAEAFAGEADENLEPNLRRRFWDFSTYLSIRDRRAVSGLGLGDGVSIAFLKDGAICWAGPDGSTLANRLLAIARDWIALGLPDIDRYRMRFMPRGGNFPSADSPGGPWAIERIDYRQDIHLIA
jgi:protein-L-isoaspartate(D-aspartate) O-methyltransferase